MLQKCNHLNIAGLFQNCQILRAQPLRQKRTFTPLFCHKFMLIFCSSTEMSIPLMTSRTFDCLQVRQVYGVSH